MCSFFLPTGSKTREGVVQGVASGTSPALAQPSPLTPAWSWLDLGGGGGEEGTSKACGGECSIGKQVLGHYGEGGTFASFTLAPSPLPHSPPAPVAEKTKEQASHLGGAVFSGAGNIAAATGLVKREEFPTDLKVSSLATHVRTRACTHTCVRHTRKPATRLPTPPASLGHKASCSCSAGPCCTRLRMSLHRGVYGCGAPCDSDPDLPVYVYSAHKCDPDHFWPYLHVKLIIHSASIHAREELF